MYFLKKSKIKLFEKIFSLKNIFLRKKYQGSKSYGLLIDNFKVPFYQISLGHPNKNCRFLGKTHTDFKGPSEKKLPDQKY